MSDIQLEVRDIAKTFGAVVALQSVSLTLRRGRVHTLLGENGAGKSTLIKILAGLYSPDRGAIVVDGHAVTIRNPAHARALGIATVFQELSLSNNMTVAENIYANHEPARCGFIRNSQMVVDCRRLLAELGIEADPHQRVGRCHWRTGNWWKLLRRSAFQPRW
ncbi:ATP-binding cassette domain-containing protein [Candidatus Sodalis endolongispinus]|uniref:ATP-binding cassette domain-containing protein n=1 Tax=Candidatus Sodalis endolongispinus TaxID=2812662 RepID=UPI001FE5623F|nr:ATP-binding cassette domain-containing protein [Candidatus Sodalis endolongispinus]